jgi:hypothetical protein
VVNTALRPVFEGRSTEPLLDANFRITLEPRNARGNPVVTTLQVQAGHVVTRQPPTFTLGSPFTFTFTLNQQRRPWQPLFGKFLQFKILTLLPATLKSVML